MKSKKAFEIEVGDAIMYKKKYFVVDWIDAEFISDKVSKLYKDDNEKIKAEHCRYTFEDGLTLNYKENSESRIIHSAKYDDKFEFLGNVKHEDYEKGLYNKNIRPKLRYAILERDNNICQSCGRGIKNGATLHIDHIIPVTKGGKTEITNLQTLCDKCNYGKGGI